MGWIEPADRVAGVRVVTTTRDGGVSAAPYAQFNLAAHVGDDPAAVAANRRRLRETIGCEHVQWLNQVHGTRCLRATSASTSMVPDADAAWTTEAGLALAVLTADCVPVVVCEQHGRAVGIAHAGWRGLVDGVLQALLDEFPAPPQTLRAWLGPAIGPPHYEVGAEVADAVARVLPDAQARRGCLYRGRPGKFRLDLFALAAWLLEGAGVGAVGCERLDTFADARFYSYRRDGITGRMATLVWRS